MTRLRPVSGRKLMAALERKGFVVVRINGSHRVLHHADDLLLRKGSPLRLPSRLRCVDYAPHDRCRYPGFRF